MINFILKNIDKYNEIGKNFNITFEYVGCNDIKCEFIIKILTPLYSNNIVLAQRTLYESCESYFLDAIEEYLKKSIHEICKKQKDNYYITGYETYTVSQKIKYLLESYAKEISDLIQGDINE